MSVSATFRNYQVVIVENKGKKMLLDQRSFAAAKRSECSVEVMIRLLAIEVPRWIVVKCLLIYASACVSVSTVSTDGALNINRPHSFETHTDS